MGGNKGRVIGEFLVHTVAATLGAFIITALVIALAGKLLSGWQPALLGTTLAIYAAAGVAVGYWINIRYPSPLGSWVWILPFIWIFVLMSDYARPGHVDWHQIWIAFFTNRCDASECMYELTGTFPFVSSVGYSVAAWVALRRRPHPSPPIS